VTLIRHDDDFKLAASCQHLVRGRIRLCDEARAATQARRGASRQTLLPRLDR
jgi:hypothetical protein